MKRSKYSFLFILIAFLIFLSVPQDTFAQQEVTASGAVVPSQVEKAIQSGKVTPQQVQEGLKALE